MTITTAKWTLDDYHQMIASGILKHRRVELLNGEIVEMAPEGPEHAYLGDETGKYLGTLLGDRARVREGRPITLAPDSEPEPDIAVVHPLGDVYRQRQGASQFCNKYKCVVIKPTIIKGFEGRLIARLTRLGCAQG